MSDQLTAEAIREITKMADQARKVKFVQAAAEPAHKYWYVGPDGQSELMEADPPLLRRRLDRPEDVVVFVEKLGDDERAQAAVFYDEKQIVCLPDAEDSRRRLVCKLDYTPQFAWLLNESKTPLSQRDFVRLLRITFRGCYDLYPHLLALIRNLKWTGTSEAGAALVHGRESLGRAIESQVSGADSIPEELVLTVPIWRQYGTMTQIACAVEIFPQEQHFKLTPYPMQMDDALDDGLASLQNTLAAGDVSVYRGHPDLPG